MPTVITMGGGSGSGCSCGVKVYGAFYDTTTQTVGSGLAKGVEFNTADISNGVTITNNSLGRPTRITVNANGVYDIQFSAQLNRTSGGNSKQADIWLRTNEIDVPWSNTALTMQANAGKIVAAWNFYVTLNAGEYAEIMWTQDDNIEIQASAASAPAPEIPSVIVTVNKVN